MRACHTPGAIAVTFDDDPAVADAGLVLTATLAEGLLLRELLDTHVDLGDMPGAANAGDKAMTLISSALASGQWIDDAQRLRAGASGQILGHRIAAPSTPGTFLRSFTWGSVRQLDRVAGEVLIRAWAAGAGPGPWPLTIDVDSTHCQTDGLAKQGATAVDRHGERGDHPLLASVAGSGDVLHSRLRQGTANTGRGAGGLWPRRSTGRAGPGRPGRSACGPTLASTTTRLVAACRKAGATYSITVKVNQAVRAAIAAIPQSLDADSLLAGGRRRRRRAQLLALWPQRPGHAPDRAPDAAHSRLLARPVLRLRLPPVHHRPPGQHLGAGGRPSPPR
jgi:hypothetical protein